MTKGRRVALVAPLIGAMMLLGAPAATFAAPREGQPPPSGQDPNAGDKAGDKSGDKADDKAGDKAGEKKDPRSGEQAGAKGKKDKDGRDRDDDDYSRRYDGPDGRYDHDRYGRHGRHGWDTHRRYYRYGYHGPGYYDDCGYYGPEGYNDWYYNSPDACDWEYGPDGASLRANLSGDQVGPEPGAPNAGGIANLFVDLERGLLCYRMGYDGINRPSGAHIHAGGPGQNGRPVIDLHPEMNGDEGCVGADPTALHNLRDHPEAFYLQLHTPEYPDGALRGQVYRTGSYG
jgi:hypothetical protein